MIRKALPFVFILILLSLDVFLHSVFGAVEVLPDVIPIALAVSAVRWGLGGTAALGFVSGVMEDSFSTTHLGLGALAWVAAGSMGASMRGSLLGSQVVVAFILVIIVKAVHEVVYYTVYLWGSPGELVQRLLVSAPVDVIVSAVLGLAAFVLLGRILFE